MQISTYQAIQKSIGRQINWANYPGKDLNTVCWDIGSVFSWIFDMASFFKLEFRQLNLGRKFGYGCDSFFSSTQNNHPNGSSNVSF